MKKDVVGMDRPRSEDGPTSEDRATHLAKVMVELEGDQVVLEERVDDCYSLISNLAIMHQENQQRIARLEKYRVDYVQVCTRVAELERTVAKLYDTMDWLWNTEREAEPLPWGDLD